jgi:hypothetical protein
VPSARAVIAAPASMVAMAAAPASFRLFFCPAFSFRSDFIFVFLSLIELSLTKGD